MKKILIVLCASTCAFAQGWNNPPTSGYSAVNNFLASLIASQAGTSLPATCVQGKDLYLLTTTTPATQYYCKATNQWQAVAPAIPNTTHFLVGGASGAADSGKSVPSGAVVGDSDNQNLTNKAIDGATSTEVGYLSGVTGPIQGQLNGKQPSGAYATCSGDLNGTAPACKVNGLANVPFCTGFSPTNGQFLQYTTASSPNPCYTAATGAGGGGVTLPLPVAMSSSTVLTIGSTCSSGSPCLVRVGSSVLQITASATATITAGTGTAYIWVTPSGVITVGLNGPTVTCSGCTATSATGFPTSPVLPVYTWTSSTPATWDSGGGIDQRAMFTMDKPFTGSNGFTVNEFSNSRTGTIDTSIILQKFFGTAAPGVISGNLPGDLYEDTTNHQTYICDAVAGSATPACTGLGQGNWMTIVVLDSAGIAHVPGGYFVNGGASVGQFSVGYSWRFFPGTTDNVSCTGGTASLNQSMSIHRVDLNNQPSCTISIGTSANDGQTSTITLCQGGTTLTTSITWSGLKGGIAAGGSTGQCAAQDSNFYQFKGSWYATTPGSTWN